MAHWVEYEREKGGNIAVNLDSISLIEPTKLSDGTEGVRIAASGDTEWRKLKVAYADILKEVRQRGNAKGA